MIVYKLECPPTNNNVKNPISLQFISGIQFLTADITGNYNSSFTAPSVDRHDNTFHCTIFVVYNNNTNTHDFPSTHSP